MAGQFEFIYHYIIYIFINQENNKKSKSKKVKASVTSNAVVQNVVQCRCHMHGSDVENHFYIYQTFIFIQIHILRLGFIVRLGP